MGLMEGDCMRAYETMIKTNYELIKGYNLFEKDKEAIVNVLMSARKSTVHMEYISGGVRHLSKSVAGGKRQMAPQFFVPPYNEGKRLKTILGQIPKTDILAGNMYELEILRLLSCLCPEEQTVKWMVENTVERLQSTCFGAQDDGVGECFDASLVVLRFLITAVPHEIRWIESRIENYNRHANEKKRSWHSQWYYWLCLSELPFEFAKSEIDKYKNEIIERLTGKSLCMNSERDKVLHPVLLCILRNMLVGYPEYAYIRERQPYVSEKDGRVYFDMVR